MNHTKAWTKSAGTALVALGFLLAGCSQHNNNELPFTPGGGGGGGTPGSASGQINAAAGGSVVLHTVHCGVYTFTFAPGALSANTTVTFTEITQSNLPAPLAKTHRGPMFTQGAGNTFVCAFNMDLGGSAITLSKAVDLVASSGATTAPAGTLFNVALFGNSTWNDVGSATVTSGGGFQTNLPSVSLPSLIQSGKYLIYEPPSGGQVVANFGLAMFVDDDANLQVVKMYDSSGNALAAPTLTNLNYPNSVDLDGAALTPDGSLGILVDGGNLLDFFTGTNLGAPAASPNFLDVSAYGSDGDSVAIMPNGNEAVVSLDSNSNLLLVSGLNAASPAPAELIPLPGDREAVTLSQDGKTLLARSYSSLTVFAVATAAPTTGPLGGSVSHTFTQTADMTVMSSNQGDGREGMAISPVDSSRAVVVGAGPSIAMLTGLPNSPVYTTAIGIRAPQFKGTRTFDRRHEAASRGSMLAVTGGNYAYDVAVSPDGKYAYVAMDTGIAVFSGVNTGTLTQVQTYTVPVGSGTLQTIRSIGITLDGKYLAAVGSVSTGGTAFETIPITASTGNLGTPVGSVTGVTVPYVASMVMH